MVSSSQVGENALEYFTIYESNTQKMYQNVLNFILFKYVEFGKNNFEYGWHAYLEQSLFVS